MSLRQRMVMRPWWLTYNVAANYASPTLSVPRPVECPGRNRVCCHHKRSHVSISKVLIHQQVLKGEVCQQRWNCDIRDRTSHFGFAISLRPRRLAFFLYKNSVRSLVSSQNPSFSHGATRSSPHFFLFVQRAGSQKLHCNSKPYWQ
jgi:hypothetical protein